MVVVEVVEALLVQPVLVQGVARLEAQEVLLMAVACPGSGRRTVMILGQKLGFPGSSFMLDSCKKAIKCVGS